MRPRFVGCLGLADAVTAANATLGFGAVAALTVDAGLAPAAARLVLLAAIADGLDGVLARRRGSTPIGHHLDSLADVASFGVAPAALVVAVVSSARPLDSAAWLVVAVGVPAAFVAVAVIRLAMYNAYDLGNAHTEGVPSTLAATLLAAAVLAGVTYQVVLVATAAFTYLMVVPIEYPDLLTRDALAMGALQALAVVQPRAMTAVFPRGLLVAALAYLVLAPRFYWRD